MYLDIYRRLCRPPLGGPSTSTEKLYDWHKSADMEQSLSSHSSTRSAVAGESKNLKLFRKRPSWWARMSLDTWIWEILAACLCICILAAIAGVLFAYDDRPVPDLPDGLTVCPIS